MRPAPIVALIRETQQLARDFEGLTGLPVSWEYSEPITEEGVKVVGFGIGIDWPAVRSSDRQFWEWLEWDNEGKPYMSRADTSSALRSLVAMAAERGIPVPPPESTPHPGGDPS